MLNTDPEAGTPEPEETIADITAQEDTESVVAVDLMSSSADFCPKGPKPAMLFGLREVLVLCPGGEDILGRYRHFLLTQYFFVKGMTPGLRWWLELLILPCITQAAPYLPWCKSWIPGRNCTTAHA